MELSIVHPYQKLVPMAQANSAVLLCLLLATGSLAQTKKKLSLPPKRKRKKKGASSPVPAAEARCQEA